jgi:hypothetical protein
MTWTSAVAEKPPLTSASSDVLQASIPLAFASATSPSTEIWRYWQRPTAQPV